MFGSVAWAQSATPPAPSMFEMVFPFLLIFLIFYFLVIRPQARKMKDHQKILTALKKGDEVITASGILGRIEGITDKFVTLEVDEGVRIRLLKSQVATYAKSPEAKT